MEPAFNDLLRMAGSSNYIHQSVDGMSRHERFLLVHTLAPFESDGPGDREEWNLFVSYLNADGKEESLYQRHNLSEMLQRWEHNKV